MQSRPLRIHIIGGPGNGKSTLARKLGTLLHLPVYDLDRIAFEGQDFFERPLQVRLAQVREIAAQPRWITEGIFLGWVQDLMGAADLIIWLDSLPWQLAAWRILVRFTRYGWEQVRLQQSWNKFTRFHDYRRHLGQLWAVMFTSRAYYASRQIELDGDARHVTRAATAASLEPYRAKVIHCRTTADVEHLLAALHQEQVYELEESQTGAVP
jgi:adenylate kinase family enzyme